MDKIEALFESASSSYNKQLPHLKTCRELAAAVLAKLAADAKYGSYSVHRAHNIETKYAVFRKGTAVSRPIAEAQFIANPNDFAALEKPVIEALGKKKKLSDGEVNAISSYIYTAVMSFAAAYDLWKPGSRKTPGTFFEVLMAALVNLHFPEYALSKHVNLGAMLGEDTRREEEMAREATSTDEEDEESRSRADRSPIYSAIASISETCRLRVRSSRASNLPLLIGTCSRPSRPS